MGKKPLAFLKFVTGIKSNLGKVGKDFERNPFRNLGL